MSAAKSANIPVRGWECLDRIYSMGCCIAISAWCHAKYQYHARMPYNLHAHHDVCTMPCQATYQSNKRYDPSAIVIIIISSAY